MTTQTELFTGKQLMKAGIQKAVDHANEVSLNWAEQAYSFLTSYIQFNDTFMCEDVRAKSIGVVPPPPNKRAWGGIMRRASKAGLIYRRKTKPVKNPKAHCANATFWGVNKMKLKSNKN